MAPLLLYKPSDVYVLRYLLYVSSLFKTSSVSSVHDSMVSMCNGVSLCFVGCYVLQPCAVDQVWPVLMEVEEAQEIPATGFTISSGDALSS